MTDGHDPLIGLDADAAAGTLWLSARTDANLALAHIPAAATAPGAISALTEMVDAPHECVRVSAAVALGFLLGEQLPNCALEVLIAAQPRAGRSPGTAEAGSAWGRPLTGFAARAIHRLGL